MHDRISDIGPRESDRAHPRRQSQSPGLMSQFPAPLLWESPIMRHPISVI
jgi:hypothetical protein